MTVFRPNAPGFTAHGKIKPMEIIEGMGGYPTDMWDDGTQLNLEYDFGTHLICFVYMHGEFHRVELNLEGDFGFRPQGTTVREIREEAHRQRGRWKQAKSREGWPDVSRFPNISYP